MKLKYSLTALAAVFVLVGCEQTRQARQLTPETSAAINASSAERQREVQAGIDSLKAYMDERRALFEASMQANLTDMDQKLTELGDTIATLEDNAFADENLSALRESRSHLDLLFEDLTKSSEGSWHDAKRILESAWADMRLAYKVVKATYDS